MSPYSNIFYGSLFSKSILNLFLSVITEGGQKTKEINQALIYMICKDNMPFSCVEKSGLRKFVHVLCPRYKLPSRAKVIKQKYFIYVLYCLY